MGLELLLPFLASVGITILLRRMDKSNYKLSQIKRYTGKLQEELQEIALEKVQSVKDSGIELDITLKQTRKLAEDVKALNEESRQLLDTIRSNRDFLNAVTLDLKEVVHLSSDIRQESQSIQDGLGRLELGKKEVHAIGTRIQEIRSEAEILLEAFQEKLNFRSDDILQSLASKIVELEGLLEAKADRIESGLGELGEAFRQKLETQTKSLFSDTVGKVDLAREEIRSLLESVEAKEEDLDARTDRMQTAFLTVSEKIDRLETRVDEKAELADRKLEETFARNEMALLQKYDQVLEQVIHSKEAFLNGVRIEIEAIRKEIEGMSLETLTRRDEILNETRRQAEGINDSINIFQEKYLEAENKLLKQADSRKAELMRQIDTFEDEFNRISSGLRSEAEDLRKEILTGLKEFHSALEVSRSDEERKSRSRIEQIRESLEEELGKLHASNTDRFRTEWEEIRENIRGFNVQVSTRMKEMDDYVKGVRSSLEEELRALHASHSERFRGEWEEIRENVRVFDVQVSTRMKEMDSYVKDIREAVEGSAADIISEAESKVGDIGGIIEEEFRKMDRRFEHFSRSWEEEVQSQKGHTMDAIKGLEERLGQIHFKGAEYLEEFSKSYSEQKDKIEEFVSKYKVNFKKDGDEVKEELQARYRELKAEAQNTVDLVKVEYSAVGERLENLIRKNEKILEMQADRVRTATESQLEKASDQAKTVLEKLKESGQEFFERQEEKIDRLNDTIDSKINKQLSALLDKGQVQLGQLEDRIAKHLADVKRNLEDALSSGLKESEGQMKDFQNQVKGLLKETQTSSEEFLRTGREEFQIAQKEYRILQVDLRKDLEEIRDAKQSLFTELEEEAEKLRSSVDDVSERMQEAERRSALFLEVKEVIERSEEFVSQMKEGLEDANHSEKIYEDLDSNMSRLRNLQDNLESRISKAEEREAEILSIEEKAEALKEEFGRMMEESSQWNDTHRKLVEAGERAFEMESRFLDLEDRLGRVIAVREEIRQLDEDSQDHKENAGKVAQKIREMEKEISVLETREKEVAETLRRTDDRLEILAGRKEEILSVEAKFDKIEDLMSELGERHKQISTLQQRLDDMKEGALSVKEDLEGLLTEAEDTFEKLSTFMDVVQTNISKSGSGKSGKQTEKDPLVTRKKATVLNLFHNFHWAPETIAEKLGLETSLVQTIIQNEAVKKG
ncbi:chromosome segregation protein SMC [Leptospira semungkisensis]|uniref:Chromosome segregation protein SMC n=2 Tax=Leptospira semungkisensis TaxID=2484985 RepID=A0A4R9FQK0_9LEPT|nr:chromosome segregation protein SMC [Leptospira semungkisensis]TGK00635.1 chromosome segregation protein SMC [Leptospira semungkisensis]